MIIFGIIQSPERNCDSLIVKQISGSEKPTSYAVDMKIKAGAGKRKTKGDLYFWRPSRDLLYAETVSADRDYAGRAITVGILLERESAEDCAVPPEMVGSLFEALSLTVPAERLAKLAAELTAAFTPRRKLGCGFQIVLATAFLLISLMMKNIL